MFLNLNANTMEDQQQNRILVELQLILKTTKQINENLVKCLELVEDNCMNLTINQSMNNSVEALSQLLRLLETIDDPVTENGKKRTLEAMGNDVDNDRSSNHSDNDSNKDNDSSES